MNKLSKLLKCLGDSNITVVVSSESGEYLCACHTYDVPFGVSKRNVVAVDVNDNNLYVLVSD